MLNRQMPEKGFLCTMLSFYLRMPVIGAYLNLVSRQGLFPWFFAPLRKYFTELNNYGASMKFDELAELLKIKKEDNIVEIKIINDDTDSSEVVFKSEEKILPESTPPKIQKVAKAVVINCLKENYELSDEEANAVVNAMFPVTNQQQQQTSLAVQTAPLTSLHNSVSKQLAEVVTSEQVVATSAKVNEEVTTASKPSTESSSH